jgi:hypothetical protein
MSSVVKMEGLGSMPEFDERGPLDNQYRGKGSGGAQAGTSHDESSRCESISSSCGFVLNGTVW